MKKRIKIILLILILSLLTNIIILTIIPNKIYAVTQSISTNIDALDNSKYPGIKDKIKSLQSKYPNWKFKLLYTKLE